MYFYFLYSMLWEVFSKIRLLFLKRCFSRFSIDPNCFSINRNFFKNFRWASVCFDWLKHSFDQSNIMNQVFKKQILTFSKTLFQKFSKLFSLSPIRTWLHLIFLLFFIILFARSLSPSTGKTLLPFFLLLFSHFMHFSCILIWGFRTYTYLGFLMIKVIFSEIDYWVLFL